ncbi:MAG: glycosyl transferase group 1 [Gemmatimonadetes bacterium]|nr:glycosyl transferase group 1 [Gemmatimonadota bacterium]
MNIAIISQYYPASYRPGFDTEFAQFVRDGHDIAIYSSGSMGSADNETIARFKLDQRTINYPNTVRDVPKYLGRIVTSLVRRPSFCLRAAGLARRVQGSTRRRITEWARMLVLPEHAPDLWLIHNLTSAIAFTWLDRLYPGVPIGLYYHGPEVPRYTGELSPAEVQTVFDECDVVFTNTRFMMQHLVERGCAPAKLRVVPGGFDFEKFPQGLPRTFRPNGRLRLISAGRLSEEKGMQFALEAVRDVIREGMRDVSFTIVGEGHLRRSLEQFVRDNALSDHVRFLGTLSSNELFREVANADALILPSIVFGNFIENQARIVQETLLLRTTVITTMVGGVPESIPDAMRPFAIPPEDSAALAMAIRRLAEVSPDDLAKLGDASRDWVRKHYDIRTINDRLLQMTLGHADPAPDTRWVTEVPALQ